MAQSTPLLLFGLACLTGAVVLHELAPSPQSLEPVNQETQRKIVAAQTRAQEAAGGGSTREVYASVMASIKATRQAMKSRPSASPTIKLSASPSASSSGSASPSASASGSLNPSASPSSGSSGSPSPGASASPSLDPTSPEALHQKAIVIDTHVESPFLISEKKINLRNNKYHVSLDKLKQGGVDVVFFSIYVHPVKYAKTAKKQADVIIAALKKEVQANSDLIEMAYSHADIQRIVSSGKIAGLMGMEGGEPIGKDIKNVDYFYKQGVRYLGPTWSVNNQLGDSAGQRIYWRGLSPLGKQVVKRMNEINMLVDVSHLSDGSFYDVLKISKQPVIASHSAVDGVRLSTRNLSNDMLKLLAFNEGVIGIMFYPPFLENVPAKADVGSVVKHIKHAAAIAGIEHVGLGSDFDGLDTAPPKGLQDASKFPAITAEMRKQGMKDADILKVLGGNYMRVFEQVLK